MREIQGLGVVPVLTVILRSLVRGPLRSCGTRQCDACRHVAEIDLSVRGDRGCGPTRPRTRKRTAGGLQSAYGRGATVTTFGFEHTRPRLRVFHRVQEEHSCVVREFRGRSTIKAYRSERTGLTKGRVQVKVFKLVEVKEGENPLHVELVTEWDYSYVLQCMAASGDTLIVGDIVRSVSLLDIDWEKGKLARKARDHQDLGPYRLTAAGNKGVIGSDVSLLS